MINVIIEYDGFREHFVEHDKIHVGNYDSYYRPEDIERQMVLESYGYKFLRINRFNLGRDQVATLSERLYALIDAAIKVTDATVVTEIRNSANRLSNGTDKHCSKCGQVKPKEGFFDPRLKGGKGGFGQICVQCKTNASANKRRKFKRHWRR